MKKILASFIVLLLLTSVVFSQHLNNDSTRKIMHNWYVGLDMGFTQFYGDISAGNAFNKSQTNTKFGTSFTFGKQINNWIGIRGQLFYGKLESSKSSESGNYYKFKSSDLLEVNLIGTLDFFQLTAKKYGNLIGDPNGPKFTLYGLIGVGLSNWKTKLYNENEKIISGNGYNGNGPFKMTTEMVIPFGFGVMFYLSKEVDINSELTWHFTNSDIVDAKEGGFKYDSYVYLGIGLTYKFNMPFLDLKKQIPKDYMPQIDTIYIRDTVYMNQPTTMEQKLSEIPEPTLDSLKLTELRKEHSSYYRDLYGIEDSTKNVEINNEIDNTMLDTLNLEFRVEIARSKTRLSAEIVSVMFNGNPIPLNWLKENLIEEKIDSMYYYMIGPFKDVDEATVYENVMKDEYGVSGADIIVYFSESKKIIPVKESNILETKVESYTYTPKSIYDILNKQVDSIKYGVQIAASQYKELPIQDLKAKFNLWDEDIRMDYNYEDRWYRYSVGEFDRYWQAKFYRNKLELENRVKGAFVVSFVKKVRVSISELIKK